MPESSDSSLEIRKGHWLPGRLGWMFCISTWHMAPSTNYDRDWKITAYMMYRVTWCRQLFLLVVISKEHEIHYLQWSMRLVLINQQLFYSEGRDGCLLIRTLHLFIATRQRGRGLPCHPGSCKELKLRSPSSRWSVHPSLFWAVRSRVDKQCVFRK